MPSTFTDFLQTFLSLKQIQNQTEQVAQRSRESAVTGMNTFMEMARHTANPMEQTALVDRFSQLGVADRGQLMGMLQHVTPTAEAMKEYDIWRGRQAQDSGGVDTNVSEAGRKRQSEAANVNATGMNAGQIGNSGFLSEMLQMAPRTQGNADEMASRLTSGMSLGESAVDQATAGLPGNELQQGAGVKLGTRMSAAQDAGNQVNWAQVRQQDRSTTLNSGQQAAELNAHTQLKVKELEIEAGKARAAASGHDPKIVDNLIQAKTSLMATLKDAKTKNPSRQELMAFIGGLNAINAQLAGFGIPNEGQIDYDPEAMVQPGMWDSLRKRLYKQPTSTPARTAPAGAGRQ